MVFLRSYNIFFFIFTQGILKNIFLSESLFSSIHFQVMVQMYFEY